MNSTRVTAERYYPVWQTASGVTHVVEREALLEQADLAEAGQGEGIPLPLDLIDANPHNPRRDLAELDQLAESIREFSLLQPIIVRRIDERYQVLGGHRRLAAYRLLHEREPHEPRWGAISAVIRNTDDDDRAYLMLLTSQLQQVGWRPREEAAALEQLVTSGRTVTQVSEVLHRSTAWASTRLRIYADVVLSALVQTRQIAPGVAQELLLVKDTATRKELAERAVAEQWSQDRARGEVRALRLDRQLRETAKRARELLTLLSSIEASQLPTTAARDLWALHGRIEQMATGKKPIFPTIEAARREAGVREEPARRRREARRHRTMPRPA